MYLNKKSTIASKLHITQPPVETPRLNGCTPKQLILFTLRRGWHKINGECSINLSETYMVLEIEEIGTYYVSLDNLAIEETEGLSLEESEMLQFWTNYGANSLDFQTMIYL